MEERLQLLLDEQLLTPFIMLAKDEGNKIKDEETKLLEDKDEDVMVRHEAAEALGAIGDRTALETLERFRYDTEIVVAESCEVAIDLLEWISGERFDYSG